MVENCVTIKFRSTLKPVYALSTKGSVVFFKIKLSVCGAARARFINSK